MPIEPLNPTLSLTMPPDAERQVMRKHVIAVVAGIASFFPWMVLGEGVGMVPAFMFVAAYYFICQFFLSRGHERAYASDWGLMLALNASTFLVVILSAALERNRAVMVTQSLPLLLCAGGGTVAGALAAAQAARSGRSGLWGTGPLPNALVLAAGGLAFGFAGLALGAMLGAQVGRALHEHWIGAAGANAGLALGVAVGTHVFNRGRGRLGLVLLCSLAIGAATWAVSTVPVLRQTGWLQLTVLGVAFLAELFAAVRLEKATARNGLATT
jgi:hypothetical protein